MHASTFYQLLFVSCLVLLVFEERRIIAISIQSYVGYQHAVLQSFVPKELIIEQKIIQKKR